MKRIKLIFQAIVNRAWQLGFLPRSVGIAIQQRREQFLLDAMEAERLDRIRNPANYRGR